MKALSLKQPFAELIVSKKKTIELRRWNTKFRGHFLVHASSSPHQASMKKFNYKNLPLGCIVGEATLVDVKHYTSKEQFDSDKNLHLADESWGGFGFIIKNAKRIDPIPAKGKLNFWEIDL